MASILGLETLQEYIMACYLLSERNFVVVNRYILPHSYSYSISTLSKPTHDPLSAQASLPASRASRHPRLPFHRCNAGVSDPQNRRAKRHPDRLSGSPSRATVSQHITPQFTQHLSFVVSPRRQARVAKRRVRTFVVHKPLTRSKRFGRANQSASKPPTDATH
jgi:hypothetical protein